MRRVGLAVLVAGIGVAGCGSFRDVFTSHVDTAARVGNKELPSARVSDIIIKLGGPNANPQAAELVAGIWVDMALFADGIAARTLKTDSAATLEYLWPQLAEQRVNAWHDTVVAHRAGVSPAAVDSAYVGNEARIFQHILFMATGSTAADTAKAKVQADKILPLAKKGDFAKLAAQYSGDGSKTNGGYLPMFPKGGLVPEFEAVAWTLAPGQVSDVVKSQFGFHIIRRPLLTEAGVRDSIASYLKTRRMAQADSGYMADLNTKHGLKVASGGIAAVRSALADLGSARKSGKAVVNYDKGAFTVGDMVHWLEALPPQAISQVKQASDTVLEQFARTLAQNSLLLREADSAKIQVNPAILQALILQFRTQVGNLKEGMGLNIPELSDSSKMPEAERRALASKKMDEYFDRIGKGQAQFRQMPQTLSAKLRSEGDFKIYQAGVTKAMETISQAQAKAKDSAGAGGAAAPAPGLQPAPGGPPTPGPAPDTTRKP